MLRKFAALSCVAALAAVFTGCEPADVPVGPAPPAAEVAPADAGETETPATEEAPAGEAPAE
jgi:hypothetical protein